MIIQAISYGEINTARLPNEYQEVEYIQSSGTQYIDTGYKPTGENMRLVMDYMYSASPNGKSLFGAEISSTFPITFYSRSATTAEFFIGSTYDVTSYNITTGTRYKLDCHANNGAFTANLNGVAKSGTYSGSLVKTLNLFLFTNNGQHSTQSITARLYSCKIYDNGTLVRDFVPCYRKADGVVGLYDLVNGVFYTNAGTGAFAKGADVSDGGSSGEPFAFTYSGDFTDNRVDGVGTVRLNTSGALTVTGKAVTVTATIVGAGGGAALVSGAVLTRNVSGGGGGIQTVEVTLEAGTYDIVIGTGGAAKTSGTGMAGNGGSTTAFGETSTGGGGASKDSALEGTPGTGGSPNGGSGNTGKNAAGGSPNGGAVVDGVPQNGGDGYVELTFS